MINNENNQNNNYINNKSLNDDIIIEKNEYHLIKNNIKYSILLIKQIKYITIKCKNYFSQMNLETISKIFQTTYDSLDEPFILFKKYFIEGKIMIKEIIYNEMIKLVIKEEITYNNIKGKEISLIYDIEPNNFLLFSVITKDSFSSSPIENTFTIFNSCNNILFLIYATKDRSIKCINLIEKKIVTEIKEAHFKFITNFKHYFDDIKKLDIIMSIASDDNEIKLWNIYNWECILHIKNINKTGNLLSATFLKENNNLFIVTSNFEIFDESEPIKIYDENGLMIKEIINSKENTFFIEIYFDELTKINYIITCNINCVKSYNYNQNILYHRYYEGNNSFHNSVAISEFNNIVNLIEICNDGNIRIWDFHLNILLNKIKFDNSGLTSMCIWDDN